MNKKQMVWHAYHSKSLSQMVDLEERRAEIEAIKPEHELPTRRRLMKVVVGDLPEEFVKACEVEVAASVACDAAWEVYYRMSRVDTAWLIADETWHRTADTQNSAAFARETVYQTHKAEIEHLHALECPDCPWDGETIFPEEVE